ncbi:MAG: RES family NAD+ phosphorylase [Bacteroidia bacterium]|nr:RES family NAD+ phosphorylase [Bacteroidia bacterium]
MILFRLCKAKFSKDLSGKGAQLSGGRWNSKGRPLIYTSESRALCTAEIAVHTPLGIIPNDYELITIEIPVSVPVLELDMKLIPGNWKSFPHSNSTQIIGDTFISENKYLVFKVPSVIVPGEHNYLINPNHNDIKLLSILSIEPFEFDKRLFVK